MRIKIENWKHTVSFNGNLSLHMHKQGVKIQAVENVSFPLSHSPKTSLVIHAFTGARLLCQYIFHNFDIKRIERKSNFYFSEP